MNRITNWLSKNSIGLVLLAAVAAMSGGAVILSGCQVTDWVTVDVPRDVQKAQGLPATVTLTEAPSVLEQLDMDRAAFIANMDDASERLGALTGWVGAIMADPAVQAAAGTIPWGTPVLMGLTGLAGLFLKGPGTQKEKEGSYAKGKADAEAKATETIATLKEVIDALKNGGNSA